MILSGSNGAAKIPECPNTDCDAEDIRVGGPYTDHQVTLGLDQPTNVEPDIVCPECEVIITVKYISGRVQVGQRGFRGVGISQPHTRIYGATSEEPRPGAVEHDIEEHADVEESVTEQSTPEQDRVTVPDYLEERGLGDLDPMESYEDAQRVAGELREDPDEQPLNGSHLELKRYIREKVKDA